jgi:hypothetical protein
MAEIILLPGMKYRLVLQDGSERTLIYEGSAEVLLSLLDPEH